MSFRKGYSRFKERLKKPFRNPYKPDEYDEDGRKYVDALNEFPMDCSHSESSGEEYYDAYDNLRHIEVGQKRKKNKFRKTTTNKSRKTSEMHRNPGRSYSTPKVREWGSMPSSSQQLSQDRSSSSRGFDYGSQREYTGFGSQREHTRFGSQRASSSSSTPNLPFGHGSKLQDDQMEVDSTSHGSESSGYQSQAGGYESPVKYTLHTGTESRNTRDFDSILMNLAMKIPPSNTRLLGMKLGFQFSEINMYTNTNLRARITSYDGTLEMLQAWRKKQGSATSREALKAILIGAHMKQLADEIFPEEKTRSPEIRIRNRKVTVTLMTSSRLSNIEGLKRKFEGLKRRRPELIAEVKILMLPYSGLQRYTFPESETVDVLVLCHSIENRRFSITDVTDSLYDEFLHYCNKTVGKDRIVVIAHDFPRESEAVRQVKMNTFKYTQPRTFEMASLALICGTLDGEPEIRDEDWTSLTKLIEEASKKQFGKVGSLSPSLQATAGGSFTKSRQPKTEKPKEVVNRLWSKPSREERVTVRKAVPTIYICTSSKFHTVKGLEESLRTQFSDYDIKEQTLPFSMLREFRFPSPPAKCDAMVLCHSVQNRGFSITDVPGSIYDDYLKYCSKTFGKSNVAVIVHDFDDKPAIMRIHIGTFQRSQSTTFELADFVAVAGRLDGSEQVQLYHGDTMSLETFLKNIVR